jgi:hypothetical protein
MHFSYPDWIESWTIGIDMSNYWVISYPGFKSIWIYISFWLLKVWCSPGAK